MMLAPKIASTYSVLLSRTISTLSPNPTPRRLSAAANAVVRSSSCFHVVVSPRNLSAGASGCIRACLRTWLFQWLRRDRSGSVLRSCPESTVAVMELSLNFSTLISKRQCRRAVVNAAMAAWNSSDCSS
ncbi:Uncharacterised protein [Mycobacteroides abscessus subsp. abscessus]|nr:Uncharacterised protein [Mycobacteroides abscessus subsp. abscessus]